MRRVSVVGNSGSGKTTLARALARALDAPCLELDALFHLPGWTELDEGSFQRRVGDVVAGDAWVVDGNYGAVRDLVWDRADTVVWVDPPRPVVMSRVVRRTLRRVCLREELWNGNREPWSNLWSLDPERSVVVWAWTSHHRYRRRYEAAMAGGVRPGLSFVRLKSSREVRQFLAGATGRR